MIEVLSKSDNPKHRNSKFLKFLKKLAQGAYTIENDNLVKNAAKQTEFRSSEEQRLKEEWDRAATEEEAKSSQINTMSTGEDKQNAFSKIWNMGENGELNEE